MRMVRVGVMPMVRVVVRRVRVHSVQQMWVVVVERRRRVVEGIGQRVIRRGVGTLIRIIRPVAIGIRGRFEGSVNQATAHRRR